MPLPANVTTVTVRGTFLTPEGDPSTGTVSFTPSSWLLNSGANIAIPNSSVVKTLGTAGDFSAVLPITDDPDLSPGGWVYSVSEVVDGVSQSYNIAIPGTVAAGGTVFLADLAPVAPAGPEYYSLASSLAIGTVTNVGAGGTPTASITGLAPSQVLNLGVPQGLPGAPGSLNEPSVQQFAADGSVLRNLPARTLSAEALLKQAVWWIDSAHSSANGQAVTNLGWGGSALNAQLGSSGSADSNDAKYLDWTGENYVYLPGANNFNHVTVATSTAYDLASIDVRVAASLDTLRPAAQTGLAGRYSGVAATSSWYLSILATGVVNVVISDGSTLKSASSTAALDAALAYEVLWLRFTYASATGVVTFYTSWDGSSWTQLGTPVTIAGGAVNTSTQGIALGAYGTGYGNTISGSFYRLILKNLATDAAVLDIDTSVIASGAATSFTALTGQTVTINRTTSGRKAVAVVHPVWLLGTDDYMEVADNALLDMGTATDFTVLAIVRRWATPNNYSAIIAKKHVDTVASAGWAVNNYATSANLRTEVADGTNSAVRQNQADGNYTLGSISLLGMRVDRTAQTQQSISGSTLSSTTSISTVGSLDNSFPLRIGRDPNSTGYYSDMEFVAAAVFRRALTAGEITTLSNYYSARIGA